MLSFGSKKKQNQYVQKLKCFERATFNQRRASTENNSKV